MTFIVGGKQVNPAKRYMQTCFFFSRSLNLNRTVVFVNVHLVLYRYTFSKCSPKLFAALGDANVAICCPGPAFHVLEPVSF